MVSKTVTRSPCKTFKKKKSLACYKLLLNLERQAFDHYELFRIVNPKPGEFYVMSIEVLQKLTNHHISYHKSGAFHWRTESGGRVVPLDGESDKRRADLCDQAFKYFSYNLDGYCLATGPRVSIETLKTMLAILDGYILPPLALTVDVEYLYANKHITIPMPESFQRKKANDLLKKAKNAGETSILSREEIQDKVRKEFGDDCKIYNIAPQPKEYLTFPPDVLKQLIGLARDFCAYKLEDRPHAFWSKAMECSNDQK